MGAFDPLFPPGPYVVTTVVYVALSIHVWIERARIANQVKRWSRSCPTFAELVRSILQISKPWKLARSRSEKQTAEADQQQAAFERSRVAACRSVLNTLCPFVGLSVFVWTSLTLGLETQDNNAPRAIILVGYLLTLFSSSGVLEITSFNLDVLFVCLHALSFVSIFFIPSSAMVILMAPVRCIIRALFAFTFARTKMTVLCNIPISLANIYRISKAASTFRTPEEKDPNYAAMGMTGEVLFFVGLILLASMVEKLFKEKVEVAMDVVNMELSLHSKSQLLSVLCDAHVTLGHDFRILGRCTELSHMLMTGFSSHSKGLEGTVFTSFMTEIDQQRFLDLVAVGARPDSGLENDDGKSSETSQSTQGSRTASSRLKWSLAPAKSIQVHIRDAAGVRFPIELFHIFLPNMHNPSAPPSHLIGIREEPGGHEISTSFQQLGSISGVPPPGRAAAFGTSAGTTPRPAEPPTRVLSDLHPKKASGSRASKASSGSGSSRGSSRTVRPDPADLPSIQRVEFQFDGMADGFPLLQARIFFDSRAATESSTCAIMNDWLMESMRPRFGEWVQHTINQGMAGRGDTFTPTQSAVELLWPGRADMALCADEVQFRVEVLAETEDLQVEQKTSQASRYTESTAQAEEADKEGQTEDDESVCIWATMRGFQQYKKHKNNTNNTNKNNSNDDSTNNNIKRTSRTPQSQGQAPTLAAIQEHDRRMFRAATFHAGNNNSNNNSNNSNNNKPG
ncbi:unnamed protein product [Polarella glacialis]|uniref:Uncharacterized protein n=1 Tax=Polarella glacialis TaxID=89957 RepID=A0A813FG58_POLGL|nr:unnamed protein product [Polarella glacialis]CAE8714608.1 unnamed protein product [Polarella glacialis]